MTPPVWHEQHLQAYEVARQRSREHVVMHALSILDPGLDLTQMPYAEALDRLAAACLAEYQRWAARSTPPAQDAGSL